MRAAASRRALRQCTRQLSSLATVTEKGAATAVNLKADGLADLPITLPIHKRGETAMEPRPGATMIEVIVDGNPVQIESGSSILQACESVGINVPRFCFHERLSVAGNCRMCLVEIEKSPKPVASCAYPTMPGMKIFTNSSMVKKAREGVMEFMLANHPLDCPICDQGGECDLQDQAMMFGSDRSRYYEDKRATPDKNLGPLVKTVMTRCIHCTRCVRFSQEVAGVNMLGCVGRGNAMEIGTYVEAALNSEMSGNVVDLCPVGALTNKPNAFAARSWEYRSTPSVDVLDGCGPSIKVDTAKGEVMRVQPRLNEAINEEWISDKTRYAVDGLKRQRLDVPLLKKDGKLVPVSWREALSAAAEKIGAAAPSELGVIAGPLADLEALVCAKDLFNKLGSTATSSTAAAGSADLRAGYTMGSTIAGIEEADAVLLVGTNLRVEAPLVNARVRKMVRHFGLKVGVVGPAADLTFEYDHIGDSAAALSQLKAGEGFGAVLGAAKRPIVLLGAGAVARPDGAAVASAAKKVAKAAGCLAEGWNGYGVLQSAGGAAGALDVGFVPGPTAGPLSALKLVYLLGADEVPFEELQPGAFVVYQGHHGDAGAQAADLVLPGAAYTEKSGTYVNTEGRVQRTARALDPPGNARDDWQILVALSQLLGKPLPYDTVGGVRERMAAIAPNLADALGVRVEAASPELAALTLEHSDASEPLSAAPLASSITNFYMTDPVSRASETMAKCYQAFGGRV